MHRQKPAFWLYISLGLVLLSTQCIFSASPEGLNSAPLESPVTPSEGQTRAEESESGTEISPLFENFSELISKWPWLLILSLLFIAVLLLLIIRLRRRPEQPPPPSPEGTRPLREVTPTLEKAPHDTLEIHRVPHLTLVTDAEIAFSYPLEKETVTIGRASDNDLIIDEHFPDYKTVSRTHARLYRRGSYWIIEDLNSQNGVYVDQQRTGCNVLQEGWTVSIGGVTFRFHSHGEEVTT